MMIILHFNQESDDMDTRALKSLLKLKIQRIEELEKQISDLRVLISEEKNKRKGLIHSQ